MSEEETKDQDDLEQSCGGCCAGCCGCGEEE